MPSVCLLLLILSGKPARLCKRVPAPGPTDPPPPSARLPHLPSSGYIGGPAQMAPIGAERSRLHRDCLRRDAGARGRQRARPLSSLAGRGAHDRKGDKAITPDDEAALSACPETSRAAAATRRRSGAIAYTGRLRLSARSLSREGERQLPCRRSSAPAQEREPHYACADTCVQRIPALGTDAEGLMLDEPGDMLCCGVFNSAASVPAPFSVNNVPSPIGDGRRGLRAAHGSRPAPWPAGPRC
jgi:hypothetical protein